MESNKIFIKNAYQAALGAGMVKNQRQFADKVGVNVSSMSRALNGIDEYTTSGLCARIRAAFPTLQLDGSTTPMPPTSIQTNSNTIDTALGAVSKAHSIIEKMQEQMDKLIDIIAKK